jgi:hypothetical protein
MSKSPVMKNQQWRSKGTYPEYEIHDLMNEVYFIISISYPAGVYHLIMEQGLD